MSKEDREGSWFEKKNKDREAQIAKNKQLNDAYQAGRNALDAKMWDAAVDNLSKASEIDAKQVAIWSSLADAYVGQAGT